MKELKEKLFKLIEKKKKYIFSLKEVNDIINQEKKLRDKENDKVKIYKKSRDENSSKISKLSKKLNSFQKQLNVSKDSSYFLLKQDYDKLNWRYQTDVFSVKVEKQIVAELDNLESRMLVSKEVKEARTEFSKISKELRKLRADANHFHEQVQIHAKESEKHHREMVKYYARKDSIKLKLKEFDDEIKVVKDELDEKYKLIRKEDNEIKKRTSDDKEELNKKYKLRIKDKALIAFEKFKKGKKITLEEFALLEEFDL